MSGRLHRFPDAEALARAAAREIAVRIAAGVSERGRFSLVLAGGGTPTRTYEILAAPSPGGSGGAIPWSAVHVFWGDERCVPPADPDSNFAAARRALLDRVAIPAANVHRIAGEAGPSLAADAYERDLRAYFAGAEAPAFDLLLLGLGEDGHTASLFPGHPACAETRRWAVAVETAAKAPRHRVSLTLPALCAARDVMFLVAGAGKRTALTQVLGDPAAAARLPAAAVRPVGRLDWYADESALGGAAR